MPTYVTVSGNTSAWNPANIWNELPTEDELKKAGLGVEMVRVTQAGTILMKTRGAEEAKKLIEWQELKEKGLNARLARTRKPRLEVKGVPKDWDAAMLEGALWKKIEEKGVRRPSEEKDSKEWVRASFSIPMRGGLKKTWIVEAHPSARKEILNLQEISGGWWRLVVRDYLDAPLCLKCQEYGHTIAYCKKEVICKWCGGEGHKVKDCQARKDGARPVCKNCVMAGKEEKETKHCAGSRECPVHLAEMEKLAKRTRYE